MWDGEHIGGSKELKDKVAPMDTRTDVDAQQVDLSSTVAPVVEVLLGPDAPVVGGNADFAIESAENKADVSTESAENKTTLSTTAGNSTTVGAVDSNAGADGYLDIVSTAENTQQQDATNSTPRGAIQEPPVPPAETEGGATQAANTEEKGEFGFGEKAEADAQALPAVSSTCGLRCSRHTRTFTSFAWLGL